MRPLNYLFLKLTANLVAEDDYGNKYFESKKKQDAFGRKKRYCFFLDGCRDETSCIPPEFHGWMHYNLTLEAVKPLHKRSFWQRKHIPNLTGTSGRYKPVVGKKYFKAYTPWNINNK